jgi:hypothetical protein
VWAEAVIVMGLEKKFNNVELYDLCSLPDTVMVI